MSMDTENPSREPSALGFLTMEIDIRKDDGVFLGLEVMAISSRQSTGMLVEAVHADGLVDRTNRASRDPWVIKSGDMIVKVNAVQGNIKAMANEILMCENLRMTVRRPFSEAVPRLQDVGLPQEERRQQQQQLQHQHLQPRRTRGIACLAQFLDKYPPPAGPWEDLSGRASVRSTPVESSYSIKNGHQVFRFTVRLAKQRGQRLGMEMMVATGEGTVCPLGVSGLVVDEVKVDSSVGLWNATHAKPCCVLPLDFVVQVNGHPFLDMASENFDDCNSLVVERWTPLVSGRCSPEPSPPGVIPNPRWSRGAAGTSNRSALRSLEEPFQNRQRWAPTTATSSSDGTTTKTSETGVAPNATSSSSGGVSRSASPSRSESSGAAEAYQRADGPDTL